MSLDLHRVLARKQERECAKADDFGFRARARTMRLFGEWLQLNVPHAQDIDPLALARSVARESDERIFDRLFAQHGGDLRQWRRAFDRLKAQAAAELRDKVGDPTPYRLA